MKVSYTLRRVGLTILLATILVALTGMSATAASARQGTAFGRDGTPMDALVDRARLDGQVRVIVRLRVGFSSSAAGDPAVAAEQRERIAHAQRAVIDRLAQRGQLTARKYANLPLMAMQVTPEQLQDLQDSPEVESVQPDELEPPTLASSVPLIGADNAWAAGYTGTGWAVAILDTGVDSSHSFLSGKVVAEACFSGGGSTDYTVCPNGLPEQIGPGAGVNCPITTEGCDHGTHVAGIAAGKGTTFSGVARDADLIAVQIFSQFDEATCSGYGLLAPCALSYPSDQISGLDWVYSLRSSYNIAAANMSLGSGGYTSACDDDPRKLAIDNLRSAGIATVIAAGNSAFTNALALPACISTAISVGASTDSDTSGGADRVASYSNVSALMSLFAPGSTITSSVPGGGFQTWNGTSMAAPHVAGVWALVKSKAPDASVSDVLSALTSSGVIITDERNGNPGVSKPRVQVDSALTLVSTVPPHTFYLPLIIQGP